jgi:hypothetical protein
MAQLGRRISIETATYILESAIDIIYDLHLSQGFDLSEDCLNPIEVTVAATVAMHQFLTDMADQ